MPSNCLELCQPPQLSLSASAHRFIGTVLWLCSLFFHRMGGWVCTRTIIPSNIFLVLLCVYEFNLDSHSLCPYARLMDPVE